MLKVRKLVTATFVGAALAACSGGDDGGPKQTPAIGITLSASTLSVTAGQNGTVTVNLTRSGGFTGDVAVAVDGLPTGVTFSANPPSLGSGVTSTVVTITAAPTAAAGTANLTVRATGTGVTAQTATLALTVAAAPAANYTLAVSPTTASVAAGGNATVTVNITRTNFTGAIALTAEGLPAGVTAAFDPASATGNTSTLTLTAAANAAANAGATVTVKGTATGVAEKTATFQLAVTTGGGGGSYTLDVTEATATVTAGGTATVNITLARTGGFADAVALTAENLPAGVTASFNPASVTGTTSVLTLTAAANAASASASVLVRGISGQQNKSDTFLLTVNAGGGGGFTLAAAPATLTVQQGTSGTSTINITRTGGFTGTVNLTATGLPNGVTAAFNPAAATGNSSLLTLTATGTAATGPATVTIQGNATGQTQQTTTIALTVTASVGGSGNTTWEFCSAGRTPIWFAVQDGANGTWTRVNPTGTKFQFNVTQAKAGIAYVTSNEEGAVATTSRSLAARLSAQIQRQLLLRNRRTRVNAYASAATSFTLNIFYGTQAELNGAGTSQCLPGSGKTVNGTVAGLTANATTQQSATISLGPSSAGASATIPSFTLENVPDGTLDLIAARTTTTINGTDFTFATDKLIIRRGVNAANNSTLPVLDFGSAEAFDPVQANLTIANLGTDLAATLTSYVTGGGTGTTGAALFTLPLPSAGPFKYLGVPANKQAAGDLHVVTALAIPNATSFDQTRFAALYFKDPTDRTITLGPTLTAPTVSVVATAPYVRFRATAAIQSQYNQAISVSFDQPNNAVTISASTGYLSGLSAYDFQIPDFTGVAGWDNAWGPKAGVETTWAVSAFAFTGGFSPIGTPVEGSGYQAASRSGTITP